MAKTKPLPEHVQHALGAALDYLPGQGEREKSPEARATTWWRERGFKSARDAVVAWGRLFVALADAIEDAGGHPRLLAGDPLLDEEIQNLEQLGQDGASTLASCLATHLLRLCHYCSERRSGLPVPTTRDEEVFFPIACGEASFLPRIIELLQHLLCADPELFNRFKSALREAVAREFRRTSLGRPPTRAAIVARIRDLISSGHTQKEIASIVNKEFDEDLSQDAVRDLLKPRRQKNRGK